MASYVGLLLSIYVAFGAWLFLRDLSDLAIDKKINVGFCCFFVIALAWPLMYLGKRP